MTGRLRNVLAGIVAATATIVAVGCGGESTTVKAAPKPEPLAIDVVFAIV